MKKNGHQAELLLSRWLQCLRKTTLVSPKAAPCQEVFEQEMTEQCKSLAISLGLDELAEKVKVRWNHRMRTSAGRASWPACEIELNPKLKDFVEGEIQRTLMHELAHLVAYARCGRRKIEPHGAEWQLACADLGIAGESRTHSLRMKGRKMQRKYQYICPRCGTTVERVRLIRKPVACLACCNAHNGGKFDLKYSLVKRRL